jgi:stearoyl-CoA desaturase (delta-9 desaturase)
MPTQTQELPEKNWTNIIFLALTPIIGIAGTALYTWRCGFEWWMPALMIGMYGLVGMAVCAGYHRYFSHKSYECSPAVRIFYAIFGAMALQDSILAWSSGHREHHKHIDSDWDPYNIQRGFWWAHIIWIFYKRPSHFENVRDLNRDPIVRWQHRWCQSVGLLGGLALPTLIGAFFGSPLAGLLWGGFLRIVVIHHTTFFVNSLAHHMGTQDYDDTTSARDNWLVAFMTLGEGYHSFHHKFPTDFRNGVRWQHWDPAKWFIWILKTVRLADKLRSTPEPLIVQTRLLIALKHMELRIDRVPSNYREEIQARINAVRDRLEEAMVHWRQHLLERKQGLSDSWRETRQKALTLQREARREWRHVSRRFAALPAIG